jgi:dihydrofolate reductase
MGKIVVTEFITLDGVVEAPGGEFHPDGKTAWVVPHFTAETGEFKLDELAKADALLLGRATYEQFAKAWPTAADEQGFADRMNSLPKYVASSTLDEPLEWNSTLIKGDLGEVVSGLKSEYERDILILGSAGLVHTLIPLGLIDEYRLMIFPVVLGSGKRLFREGIASLPLRLVHTSAFASGVVVHAYEPIAGPA